MMAALESPLRIEETLAFLRKLQMRDIVHNPRDKGFPDLNERKYALLWRPNPNQSDLPCPTMEIKIVHNATLSDGAWVDGQWIDPDRGRWAQPPYRWTLFHRDVPLSELLAQIPLLPLDTAYLLPTWIDIGIGPWRFALEYWRLGWIGYDILYRSREDFAQWGFSVDGDGRRTLVKQYPNNASELVWIEGVGKVSVFV